MSESRAFCPKCGDPMDPDRADHESPGGAAGPRDGSEVLCDACYLEQLELVDAPDELQLTVCARCGAVHRGNRWVDVGAEDYTDVAVDSVAEALGVHLAAEDVEWVVEPEQVDQNNLRVHAHFSGVVRDEPVTETATVPVSIARQTCTRCGRIAGDYYAAVVQVRAADRTPTREETDRAAEIAQEVVEAQTETGDREAFVTEIGETSDGLDVKVSTSSIGRKVATRIVEEHGGSVSSHETLVTEDEDGNEVYRVTYAVRLPPYQPGAVISLAGDDEGPVLVTSAHGNLKGRRLRTGERYEAEFSEGDAPEATRLGDVDDGVETTLVAVEDDRAVQVLDPETYEAKTVARPDYLDPDAETVTVIKHREGLHVLPDNDG